MLTLMPDLPTLTSSPNNIKGLPAGHLAYLYRVSKEYSKPISSQNNIQDDGSLAGDLAYLYGRHRYPYPRLIAAAVYDTAILFILWRLKTVNNTPIGLTFDRRSG